MFADEDGKFISQRRYPTMALIAPKLLPSLESPTVRRLHGRESVV